MSSRKAALAALDALHRVLNKGEEFEAENATAKRDLEATQAALAETQARLETTRAELVVADAEYAHWREVTERQRLQGNTEIDRLGAELEALRVQVAERRAEHDNIIAGIAALHERLKVG